MASALRRSSHTTSSAQEFRVVDAEGIRVAPHPVDRQRVHEQRLRIVALREYAGKLVKKRDGALGRQIDEIELGLRDRAREEGMRWSIRFV